MLICRFSAVSGGGRPIPLPLGCALSPAHRRKQPLRLSKSPGTPHTWFPPPRRTRPPAALGDVRHLDIPGPLALRERIRGPQKKDIPYTRPRPDARLPGLGGGRAREIWWPDRASTAQMFSGRMPLTQNGEDLVRRACPVWDNRESDSSRSAGESASCDACRCDTRPTVGRRMQKHL